MNKKNNIILICSAVIFLLFIFATSPYQLPLLFILAPLIPAIVIIVIATKYLLNFLNVSAPIAYKITVIIGLIAAVTAILLSLGQFTARDFLLLFLFGLVGTFYISRMFRP